jgi:hypothetical protein
VRIDLLEELGSAKISMADAYRIYDDLMKSSHGNPEEELGLSKEEWTAFAHGVDFDELARWRTEGWPDRCNVCGRAIDVSRFGWLATEAIEGASDSHVLTHVDCL